MIAAEDPRLLIEPLVLNFHTTQVKVPAQKLAMKRGGTHKMHWNVCETPSEDTKLYKKGLQCKKNVGDWEGAYARWTPSTRSASVVKINYNFTKFKAVPL